MEDLPIGWAGLVGAIALLLTAVGHQVPRISNAIAEAFGKWANAKAEAEKTRAETAQLSEQAKLTAEQTKLAAAQTARLQAEQTGKYAASQDERIDDLEKRLRGCEQKHSDSDTEIHRMRTQLEERASAMTALSLEVSRLRVDMMAGVVGALLEDVTRLSRALVSAFRANPAAVEPAIEALEETLVKAERMVR